MIFLLIRDYLFARFRYSPGSRRSVERDLSDKATFFAWQRNHMANERTFLAWCRTGISLIAFGFVIERFDILIREMRFLALPGVNENVNPHLHTTHVLGIVALGLGVAIVVLAGWRFFYIRRHIDEADQSFSVIPDTFLLSSVLLIVAAAFVFFAFYF
jgi:putative membrane protein